MMVSVKPGWEVYRRMFTYFCHPYHPCLLDGCKENRSRTAGHYTVHATYTLQREATTVAPPAANVKRHVLAVTVSLMCWKREHLVIRLREKIHILTHT